MTETPPIAASVLLRHTLPDGSWHDDWMIERPGDRAEHRLATFRTAQDLRTTGDMVIHVERIHDHRARYLSYEGEIGGARGRVDRVWRCEATVHELGEAVIDVELRWGDGEARRFRGGADETIGPGSWKLERVMGR